MIGDEVPPGMISARQDKLRLGFFLKFSSSFRCTERVDLTDVVLDGDGQINDVPSETPHRLAVSIERDITFLQGADQVLSVRLGFLTSMLGDGLVVIRGFVSEVRLANLHVVEDISQADVEFILRFAYILFVE